MLQVLPVQGLPAAIISLFQEMKDRIDEETVKYLWRLRPVSREGSGSGAIQPVIRKNTALSFSKPEASLARPVQEGPSPERGRQPARTGGDDARVKTIRRETPKVGRNDPCPCGSGKKFKKCHGSSQ